MHIDVSLEEGILRWHLNRPSRGNALGVAMAADLEKLTDDLNESIRSSTKNDSLEARILVISAEPIEKNGRYTWIAGGDLKELAELKDPKPYAQKMAQVLLDIERLPIPVIMEIDGAAIGGGVEFALAGDFRYATAHSTLQFKQIAVGLATGYASTKRIVDLVGLQRAKELLFIARTLKAEQAVEYGLINQVCKNTQDLKETVQSVAMKLASLEPLALAAQKEMIRNATAPSEMTVAAELKAFAKIWRNQTHEDFLSGF